MEREIIDQLQIIRERWGVAAFQEIQEYVFKIGIKMEDLRKSRDNWRKKYEGLRTNSLNRSSGGKDGS